MSAGRSGRLGRKLLLAGLVGCATAAGALVALERWIAARDVWGVSFFADVQRYLKDGVEPVLAEGPGGRLFQNRPGVDLALHAFRFRTDGERLRRGEAEPAWAPGEPGAFDGLRVLCLGDSVTLGWGVTDEVTWVRLLEREGRAADGRRLACFNAGHLMYDSRQEAALLDAWGERLRPDVVLLTFVFNDLYPTWDQLSGMTVPPAERGAGQGVADASGFAWRAPAWLGRRLPHVVQLWNYWRQERAFDGAGRMSHPPLSYYPSGWPRCAEALERIRARCDALGARLVLCETNQYGPPVVELAAWCEARGVPRVTTTFTPDELARGVQLSRVDPHANALGNRLIADKVLAALRALGILAPG